MKELTGSVKQIEWATTLRANWINQLNDVIAHAQARVDNGSMPQAWVDCVKKEAKEPLNRIDDMTLASRFIDGRKINLGNILSETVAKNYEN